jgi:hypothetical protein
MGRHRRMYYATGLPGWMRFGFSPGWLGRSPLGLGPCASYMMTGTWGTPQAQAYWDALQSGALASIWPWGVPYGWLTPDEELGFLKAQAEMLAQQIESVNMRISELEQKAEDMQSSGGEQT